VKVATFNVKLIKEAVQPVRVAEAYESLTGAAAAIVDFAEGLNWSMGVGTFIPTRC
jgi:hypothetical protein